MPARPRYLQKIILLLALALSAAPAFADGPEPLEIGAAAPDFALEGTDGRTYTLADFADAKLLAIVFTANHCPTAQAYETRIMEMAEAYGPKGVAVVAVSPNDPKAVRLDELGYTDLGDTMEDMQLRAEAMGFNFPYLYDGDTHEMSKAYGPVATPHIFIFDQSRRLRYQGRIDNNEAGNNITDHDAKNALDALLAGRDVPVATTKVFGCSIKWNDKRDSVARALKQWAEEEVALTRIDTEGIEALMQNESDKLRLINVWATWCGPCVSEFPELVDINRMYRNRDFEMITISSDVPDEEERVRAFLKKHEASMQNYLFDSEDSYALIEAVDPEWAGALPYTVLVAPGGEVVYREMGEIDPLEVKRAVVDYLGRYYHSKPGSSTR